ncbi:MAG: toll/interleukin-1 receptor domain-containing protein [Defluviitaleaceae bacterium]|nr:toll/interleukin-1 receptor domain-containing protein [Defluviitaleaceae bacterium]
MYSVTTEAVRYGMHPRDVYICYSGANADKANEIIRQLEEDYGWTCWYAERDLPPGSRGDSNIIAEMIEKSTVFLLLSSAGATNSQYVQMAVSHALALEMKRIELKIDNGNDRALIILNQRLCGLIKKKGASYKDSDFVDEGVNIANQIGVKALIFLFIAVVGGFIAVRALDVYRMMPGQHGITAETTPLTPGREAETETHDTFALAMERANEGDTDAKYILGNIFYSTHDFVSAAYWYRKAAEKQHLDATLALGIMYWDGARDRVGHTIFSDRVEGFLWLHRAAALGYADMQEWVAGFYRSGVIITASYRDSADLAITDDLSIEITPHNNQNSDGNMVLEYLRTIDVPQDYEKALYWYRKAAEQGHSGAQTTLGVMYILGQGVEENPERATYWYKRAAVQGNAIAQGNLGISYFTGQGVDQCSRQAEFWFRTSAEQNNYMAQVNLAWMYENGHIGPPSLERSFYWNRRAARLGNITAQSNTGLMYMQGRGVQQCYIQAAHWFTQAAERGCERALEYLALLPEPYALPENSG